MGGSYSSTDGFLYISHNTLTVLMFVPSVILHEFEINDIVAFFNSVDKQSRYDINGRIEWHNDNKIYDALMAKCAEFQRMAMVSSYSLLLGLVISFMICIVYTAYNLGLNSAATGPVEYVVHYLLVFSATEGLIRRSSTYNDRVGELTNLIRFESPFLIKIFSFTPNGLLLLSFYVSFFSLTVKMLFTNSL
jgi:hypothetical protein